MPTRYAQRQHIVGSVRFMLSESLSRYLTIYMMYHSSSVHYISYMPFHSFSRQPSCPTCVAPCSSSNSRGRVTSSRGCPCDFGSSSSSSSMSTVYGRMRRKARCKDDQSYWTSWDKVRSVFLTPLVEAEIMLLRRSLTPNKATSTMHRFYHHYPQHGSHYDCVRDVAAVGNANRYPRPAITHTPAIHAWYASVLRR